MNKLFSIIICAYNPNHEILQRLLDALEKIAKERNNPTYELIIVDNNSNPALDDRTEIMLFKNKFPNTIIIKETKPGLTAARIAGVKQATGEWVIFFDDDNEPEGNYLVEATSLIDQYPQTGVWGPGKVKVEFIGEVSPFAVAHKDLFQERNMSETVIDNIRWGQTAYPYGTGMIVKKVIIDEYVRQVENGAYTMSDRIGKSLISGGDIQILLTGIKMGFYAGSSPQLKLSHLIKKEKTEFKKMLQLVFMLNASAIKTYNQVFPEEPHEVVKISNGYVLKTLYSFIRIDLMKRAPREFLFVVAQRMGEMYAHIIASETQKCPLTLSLIYKLIVN